MNKDLLPQFIEIATRAHKEVYRVTETDDVINYSWEIPVKYYKLPETYDIPVAILHDRIKEQLKSGWKVARKEWDSMIGYPDRVAREFFSITYDKSRDKISLSRFSVGYGYKPDSRVQGSPGNLTGRIYPFRRNQPLLCITDRVWAFTQVKGKKRYRYEPRVYTGRYFNPEFTEYLKIVLKCSEEVLRLNISYPWMKERNFQIESINKKFPGILDGLMNCFNKGVSPTGSWDYNWLINISGNQPRELLKMINWRVEEGLIPRPKDKYDIWNSSSDFLRGDPVREYQELPF